MSSKTDVIYSHKKFKKAATLEACERREREPLPYHLNNAPKPGDKKLFYDVSSSCMQTYHSKGDYLQQKALSSDIQKKEAHPELRKANAVLNRSISLPVDCDEKILPGCKVSGNKTKPLYKPKFRVQYSIEDSSVSQQESMLCYNSQLSRTNTYHNSSVSTCKSSDHVSHLAVKSLSDDAPQKLKCDPTSRPTGSQSLWKGIKSPSPELVGQHITNLIVQNKAIVETHSPFWPMKYKRQSSVGSILDGDTFVKAKRSTPEMKYRSHSRSKSPHCNQYEGANIDHQSQASLLSIQATNTTTYPVSTIKQIKYNSNQFKETIGISDDRKVRFGIMTDMPLSSNLRLGRNHSHSDASMTRQLSDESDIVDRCRQCGMLVDSNNMLYHMRVCCKKSTPLEVSIIDSKLHQDEAIDLQMKNNIIKNKQFSSDNQVYLNKVSEKEKECVLYPYQICSISSPKVNIKHQNVEVANVVLSNVNLPNGKVYCQNEYGRGPIGELHKPKSNTNLIYGGEVKICDGNVFKTFKIDSMKKEAPSLDLCLASQHLGGRDPSIQSQPQTSVVVKFAKCGLSSGGTMVKVDSQKYQSTETTCNSQRTSSYYSFAESCEKESSLSNSLLNTSSVTLIPLISPESPKALHSDSVTEKVMKSCTPVRDCGAMRVHDSLVKRESPHKQQMQSNNIGNNPVVLSIGVNNVPYVPGIPGPYSQPNGIIPLRQPLDIGSMVIERNSTSSSSPCKSVYSMARIQSDPIPFVYSDKNDHPFLPVSKDDRHKGFPVPSLLKSEQELSDNVKSAEISSSSESCFVVPRKRPSTLPIKPAQLNSKSSLIGSTLVSPDTPRPRKSCAQLLLNGSAYTYLNMKVSTKTFFCCIYRPQPMYVLQATNPKLSMYSNWQVRKTEDPLNLSPAKLMSSYISGVYYDRRYTIAKPRNLQMIITPSSPVETDCRIVIDQQLRDNSPEKSPLHSEGGSMKRKSEDEISEDGAGKRVKIFEGGFKTNEDYTYVRGRGRGRYVCETCGIRCKKPSMLKKHIRTHTDLRPFSCIHCSFSFKTKGNLTKHLKSKAHYKRCTEMGIRPVPTVVDDTHINKEALELQGKIDLTINSCQSADDEDDSDDDNDESDDEEFDELDEDEKFSESAHDLTLDMPPEDEDDSQPEGPIDLSIKRWSDKNRRPKSLSVMRPPFAVLTPSLTPIKEQPNEILSPVTESSHLLKSIYATTLRVSKATEKVSAADPEKETGCGGSMLQKYLREIAVLDIARKRKYIKVTECQVAPAKRAKIRDCSSNASTIACSNSTATVVTANSQYSSASDIAAAIIVSCEASSRTEETVDATSIQNSSNFLAATVVLPTRKRELSPITYRSSSCRTTNVIHTKSSVPANMVVVNTSGSDSKASFMSPSGVIPTPLNRPGCDDGKSKCPICQKEFTKQSQLSLHMNIHYIERPHRCQSCGVSFRTNGHLQKHMRSVSHYKMLNMNMTFGTPSTDNPRPFKCRDCKSAFRIHGHLAKHLRSKLHIMRLECLGKLPFGTYAEIERSGVSLNEIDTSDCENSLDSLQVMASKMHEKDPTKLASWATEPKSGRVRTVSNSSNNSDDYVLEDEQDPKQAEDEMEPGLDDDPADVSMESSAYDEDNMESDFASSSAVL